MSYCRFSSEDFSSDVYCIANAGGGYTIYVAGVRCIGDIPKLLPWEIMDEEYGLRKFTDRFNEQLKFVESCPKEEIKLQYAGDSLNEPDAVSFLNRLEELRKLGYSIPDYVFEEIKDEIEKEKINL